MKGDKIPKMPNQSFDHEIIITGGGPGGLTAAIYSARARRKTLLLEKAMPGGQMAFTALIENFPGFPEGSSGMDLAQKIVEQAERFGTDIYMEEVKNLTFEQDGFTVHTNHGQHRAPVVIVSSGSKWKMLGIPGEKRLSGKGVSYCATCDAMLFRDKEVVVVGGGDTALVEALFLTKHVKHLHLVHRRDELRAEKILQERAFENEKISIIWDSIVTEINGDISVESVKLKNKKTGEEKIFPTEGVFIFVGNVPNSDFLPENVKKTDDGHVVINQRMETNLPGLYAIGDVRHDTIRQVVAAAGDGAIAAWHADKFLDKLE